MTKKVNNNKSQGQPKFETPKTVVGEQKNLTARPTGKVKPPTGQLGGSGSGTVGGKKK
jgi:hypothetical protein